MDKINLAFIWHQHQPYYKIPATGMYSLPWVRMHAVKDYYDLPVLLREFPTLRQTFNLTPSLLFQIDDYVLNGAADRSMVLTMKPADRLTDEDKKYLKEYFFMSARKQMIEPNRRYFELWSKRDHHDWSIEDWRDLQMWFQLAWIGSHGRGMSVAQALLMQERNFQEEDKSILLDLHRDLLSQVIPLYSEMAEQGQIELSTSPMYHPILPLLCDLSVGGNAEVRWEAREDAESQIRRGMEVFEKYTGRTALGMWPSEGAVSAASVELLAKCGIRWTATDEAIWEHSEKASSSRHLPHVVQTAHGNVLLLFRDRGLSDAIGFRYSQCNAEEAVHDFISRVEGIRDDLLVRGESPSSCIVSVILDGENCWEYYEDNGRPFLRLLYETLSSSSTIRTCTVSEYLGQVDEQDLPVITRLHAGSWIHHNFDTWYGGHPEKKQGWEALCQTRDFLVAQSRAPRTAWEELYIAEGSDWFWWFGDDHAADQKHEFDNLFRQHLRRVYELCSCPPPERLHEPILRERAGDRPKVSFDVPLPTVDGRILPATEWMGTICYRPDADQGAMHHHNAWIQEMFGLVRDGRLLVRVDFKPEPIQWFAHGKDVEVEIRVQGMDAVCLQIGANRVEVLRGPCERAVFHEVLELAIPVTEDAVSLRLHVRESGTEIGIFPYFESFLIR